MGEYPSENLSDGLTHEDALENLLDEVSDEDFGATRIDDTTKAVLKEWSAQDFASIYTRFRPHLERQARRFLRNQSQVDEVVQDAFLYLMVTLPELDSELGVLRFLKWKTRLLCLDVIRASGRAQISDIDAHPEFEATNTDVSAEIEHAEDAAIVRLALSKLNPRHREVLIASMYEEKTSAEIAAQVGLTENATNQLIFRARSAFKKALLGDDVDTSGMSVSKILSVAARKAAFEAKKVGAQAMVFVLFLILGIGAVVNFTSRPNNQIQAGPAQSPSSQTPSTASSQAPTAEAIAPAASQTGEVVQNPSIGNLAIGVSQKDPSLTPAPRASAPPTVLASSGLIEYAARAASVAATQASQIQEEIYLSADNRQVISVKGAPLSAKFEYSLESASISSLIIIFELDGQTFRTYPYSYSVSKNGVGSVSAIGQLGYFIDSKSRIVTENPLQSAKFELNLQIDGSGKAVSAELKLTN